MAKEKKDISVRAYDIVRVREYSKIIFGFLFSWEKVIRAERLKDLVVVSITTGTEYDEIDRIVVNGELFKLTKINKSKKIYVK